MKTDLRKKLEKVYLDATHINTQMGADDFIDKIIDICFPVNKCCDNGDCPHCQSMM